jgi:CRISPR-associated protein Cmr6
MADFPITQDYAELVGPWAEGIENRSLLFEKFAMPKQWIDDRPYRNDEAFRWSLLRVSENGLAVLDSDHAKARGLAAKGGDAKRVNQAAQSAEVLGKLKTSKAAGNRLVSERKDHSSRLLQLVKASYHEDSRVFAARLKGRLAINLADGLIENAGASLDRLFGMPFIPGSAVKGAARHAALRAIAEEAPGASTRQKLIEDYIVLFGCTQSEWSRGGSLHPYADIAGEPHDRKGSVNFLPAYPLSDAPLEVDLTNVHTPKYYTGRNAGEPGMLAEESPRPNPFPVVAEGSVFGFCLVLNGLGAGRRDLLEKAQQFLEMALTVSGIGAKTSAGYGWFEVVPADPWLPQTKAASGSPGTAKPEGKPAAPAAQGKPAMDDQTFAMKVLELPSLPEPEQREILQMLLGERKERLKKWDKSKKDADRKRVEAIRNVAQQLEIQLP